VFFAVLLTLRVVVNAVELKEVTRLLITFALLSIDVDSRNICRTMWTYVASVPRAVFILLAAVILLLVLLVAVTCHFTMFATNRAFVLNTGLRCSII